MSGPSMAKSGWELLKERDPARCYHFIPLGKGHEMRLVCWCKPHLQNEVGLGYSVVHHENRERWAKDHI